MPRRRSTVQPSVWNAGTAVNVFAIPALTFVFLAGGFYFVDKFKFEIYDAAAADVKQIQLHNASQDEQVREMKELLTRISSKVDALQSVQPTSGPGAGGGSAVGGGVRGH